MFIHLRNAVHIYVKFRHVFIAYKIFYVVDLDVSFRRHSLSVIYI